MIKKADISIDHAVSVQDVNEIRTLFEVYQRFLGIDLTFQGFPEEMAKLPGKYAPPRGRLYLARCDGEIAGCAAFYPLTPTITELKRLYVRPAFAGHKIGRMLLERALEDAALLDYSHMRLDSLGRLSAARKLYEQLGFYEIEPYNESQEADAYYMEKSL